MNKETLEHISSLMDGELSRETGLFLTRRLSSDAALGQTWRRYHLIRDCMRQPGGRAPVVDFSGQVRRLLADDTLSPSSEAADRRWLRPVAGLAIAATVAFMAILSVGPGQTPVTETTQDSAAVPSFSSPNVLSSGPATQAASFNPESQAHAARLNSYLLRHNQIAGSAGRQGFVSFVPIISATPLEAAEPSGHDATSDAAEREVKHNSP